MASRDEWRKLVEQWKRSRLSAAEFGAPLGIDSQSLRSWKRKRGREQRSRTRRPAGSGEVKRDKAIRFVELGARRVIGERRFELALVQPARRGLNVVHQTGAAMADEVRERYRTAGIAAEISPFIEDMARAYASASLVIARAGATSLAEMCAIGRPSILIPYPYAAEGHQEKNAAALVAAGAAVMVRESELNAADLAREINRIFDEPGLRLKMAEAARRQGRPEAAALIVDDLGAWLGFPGDAEQTRNPIIENAEADANAPGGGNGGVVRRSRVKRCELRLREIDAINDTILDAAG